MADKIFVVYPKEIIPKEETGKAVMMYAGKEWEGTELDFTEKNSLKAILSMFGKLEEASPKYAVDEVKLTVGLTVDESGKVRAGIAANFLNFLKGKIDAEVQEKNAEEYIARNNN